MAASYITINPKDQVSYLVVFIHLFFKMRIADAVSRVRNLARKYGMSLVDCACIQLNLPVLTGDKAWTKVDLGVKVVLIRD